MFDQNDLRQYAAFDDETKAHLMVGDAAKLRRSGELLALEAAQMFSKAAKRPGDLDAEYSLQRALQASGEMAWTGARREEMESGILARAFQAQPRSPGSSFFVNERLCGKRTLTVDGTSSASVGDRQTTIGQQSGGNSFLELCTVIGPNALGGNQLIAQFADLPVVTINADETTAAADTTPDVAGSSLTPVSLSTYATSSKRWALQTPGGAQALQAIIATALRREAMLQIVEADGTSGSMLGLVNNADVASGSGTSLAWAGVCTAMEAIEGSTANDGSFAWVLTSGAAEILRQRERASSSGVILDAGRIGPYPAIIIGGSSANHAVLGRWSDLAVVEFGPLELQINPFANFQASIIGVRGWFVANASPMVLSSFFTIPSIT